MVTVLVKNNADALDSLEQISVLPQALSPALAPDAKTYTGLFPNFMDLQRPLRLLMLRAKLRQHQGNARAAWQDTSLALRLVNRLDQAGGTLVEGLISGRLRAQVLQQVRGLMPQLPKGALAELRAARPTLAAWREHWKGEYWTDSVVLQEVLAHPELSAGLFGDGSDGEVWSSLALRQNALRFLPQAWMYQPGRTFEQLSMGLRQASEQAGVCPAKAVNFPAVTNTWFEPNVVGRGLLRVLTPAAQRANDQFCALMLDHAVTEAMAVVLEAKTSQVALPLDPWTGKPLVWDAKTRSIRAANGKVFALPQ